MHTDDGIECASQCFTLIESSLLHTVKIRGVTPCYFLFAFSVGVNLTNGEALSRICPPVQGWGEIVIIIDFFLRDVRSRLLV